MCNYHCPHAERKACAGFLLCRLLYKDGINYGIRENAMTVICAHQKQCMGTGRMENSEDAKNCEIAVPKVIPEPEVKPKTSRKKT